MKTQQSKAKPGQSFSKAKVLSMLTGAMLALTCAVTAQINVASSVIASGGGISSGGFLLAGTIGQSVIGRSGGTSTALQGFWHTIPQHPVPALPDDIAVDRNDRSPHLWPNMPNPFSDNTVLRIDLPERCHLTLKIYDALDREVRTLIDGEHEAGRIMLPMNAAGLESGHYTARLIAGRSRGSIILIVVK